MREKSQNILHLPTDLVTVISREQWSLLPSACQISQEFLSLVNSNLEPYKAGDPEKRSVWLLFCTVKEGIDVMLSRQQAIPPNSSLYPLCISPYV